MSQSHVQNWIPYFPLKLSHPVFPSSMAIISFHHVFRLKRLASSLTPLSYSVSKSYWFYIQNLSWIQGLISYCYHYEPSHQHHLQPDYHNDLLTGLLISSLSPFSLILTQWPKWPCSSTGWIVLLFCSKSSNHTPSHPEEKPKPVQ